MNMKKYFTLLFIVLTFFGCDSVYRYVFLPPEKQEYTLVPDQDKTSQQEDTSYFVSKDGSVVGYNAKSWKIEIRYMSDYQLNNFEFKNESSQGEFSGNPFTYGNWIDPKLGYSPRRFSVFKVTIFNYTNSKLNFDPEISLLETDRGDRFNAYGREQKNSKFQSIEEYFQRRKGTSGVDDEIFETRMGIARRHMLYYGKPIYKGDSRDGLVVFDPVEESVSSLKISVKDFILEYDENNEPSAYKDFVFYFKQIPFDVKNFQSEQQFVEEVKDTNRVSFSVAQIQYTTQPGPVVYSQPWNPFPKNLPFILNYAQRQFPYIIKNVSGSLDQADVFQSRIAFIFGGGAIPEFSNTFISNCAQYLSEGGFIYIDNMHFSSEYPFSQSFEKMLREVQKSIPKKTEFKRINLDHPIFETPNKFTDLPKGFDDFQTNVESTDHLKGLFIEGKLVAILSSKGYPLFWSESSSYDNEHQINFGMNVINYAIKK